MCRWTLAARLNPSRSPKSQRLRPPQIESPRVRLRGLSSRLILPSSTSSPTACPEAENAPPASHDAPRPAPLGLSAWPRPKLGGRLQSSSSPSSPARRTSALSHSPEACLPDGPAPRSGAQAPPAARARLGFHGVVDTPPWAIPHQATHKLPLH